MESGQAKSLSYDGTTMPAFSYSAMDSEGNEVQGTVEAGTKSEAADRLRAQGYFTTRLIPAESDPNRSWPCPRCGFALVGPVERCDQCGAWVSQPEVSVSSESAQGQRASTAPTDLDAQILELMRQGNKIQAIKIHREATGVGLAESKYYVEALAAGSPNAVAGAYSPPTDLEAQILELMRQDQKIQAIKIHRQATGAGLKESKEFVEALARSQNIPVRAAGCATTSAVLVLLVVAAGLLAFF